MDTIPSTVSLSLKVPAAAARVHRTSNEFSKFKPTSAPPTSSSHIHQQQLGFPHKNLATKTSCSNFLSNSSSSPLLRPCKQSSAQLLHKNSATGYATALIDVAAGSKYNSLRAVDKDVKRLLRLMNTSEQLREFMRDPRVKESQKGKVVKEIAEKGKFQKHLVVLLNMLAEKSAKEVMMVQVGSVEIIITDVLMEFERIYYELSGRNYTHFSST